MGQAVRMLQVSVGSSGLLRMGPWSTLGGAHWGGGSHEGIWEANGPEIGDPLVGANSTAARAAGG